jgi:hypothetical protein
MGFSRKWHHPLLLSQSCSHRGLAQEAMFVYTVGNPTL